MKFIIDTHVFIWANVDETKVSPLVKSILSNPENSVYLSAVSIWEMSIKSNLKKLDFNDIGSFVNRGCVNLNCKVLPILVPHILLVENLENHHKDPFDRLLIAQSIITQYQLITVDRYFADYSIKTVW